MFYQLVSSHPMRHFTLLEQKPSLLQDFQTEVSNACFYGQAADLKIVLHTKSRGAAEWCQAEHIQTVFGPQAVSMWSLIISLNPPASPNPVSTCVQQG